MHLNSVRSNKLRASIVVLFLASATLLVGCGGDSDLAEVRGVVTLDGEPIANAFLEFTPESSGAPSYGKTDAAGKYRMLFTDTKFGSFIGKNRVSISTGDVGDNGGTKEVIPSVYNTKTELVKEVKAGDNTFDFDLKSDASKIQQVSDADQ